MNEEFREIEPVLIVADTYHCNVGGKMKDN